LTGIVYLRGVMARTLPTIACFVALLCACGDVRDAGSERIASVPLTASRINAGATGRAIFSALGERTQVSVIVSGVPPDLASRPVHLYTILYAGGCADHSGTPAYALTEQVLAQSPRSTVIAPAAGPFTITNVAPVALDALLRDGYAIRIVTAPADGSREIFCGEIR
jgi:hypothetical protein